MAEEKKTYPHLLSKAPCGNDLFKGQAHDRLAKKIADQICEDEACSIVGIDGGWGSGKSNLIRLVAKNLGFDKNEGKYHMFVYDAWGHQNDPHKRTILEELIGDLVRVEMPIFDGDNWKNDLENLLAKRKHTSTKSIPALSCGVIASVLIICFTPFLTWCASLFSSEWVKALWLTLPAVLGYGIAFYLHVRDMKEKYGEDLSWTCLLKEFFFLYTDKIEEITKHEVISEREPSSNQFRDWIGRIDADLQKTDHVLLFVIDNMDRLPKIKVQELWSAIHTIFSEKPFRNIRVIVPFDRAHINNAFQSEDIVAIKGTPRTDSAIKCYGDDFINKTFHVIYRVPQPILSDWKRYFSDRWVDAFGPDKEIDDVVLQIFDLKSAEHTPRTIIAFINDLVTLRSVVDVEIPDMYLAIYIFGRSSISIDPAKEILNPSYLSPMEFMFASDKDLPKYISAIFYQLPVDQAMDVVFTDAFARELNDNKPELMLTMFRQGGGTFWDVIFNAIANVTVIPNVVLALDTVLADAEGEKAKRVWHEIYNKYKNAKLTINKSEGYHKVLLSHVEPDAKRELTSQLVEGYMQSINNTIIDVPAYISAIDELRSVEEELVDIVLDSKQVNISAENFVMLLSEAGGDWSEYGLQTIESELDAYLAERTMEQLTKLEGLEYVKNHYKLPNFEEYVKQLISTEVANAEHEAILFHLLWSVRSKNIVATDLLTVNNINNLYPKSKGDFRIELLAMRVSLFAKWSCAPDYTQQDVSIPKPEDVKALSAIMEHYSTYGEVLLSLKSCGIPMLKAIARQMTVASTGTRRMNILDISKDFSNIVANSDITNEELMRSIDAWREHKTAIEQKHVPDLSISLYETAKVVDTEVSKYILSLADGYLASLTQEQWKENLVDSNSFVYQLLSIYHPNNYQHCYDAFKVLLTEYVQDVTNLPANTIDLVCQITKEHSRSLAPYWTPIRDIFNNGAVMTKAKFVLLGEHLLQFGKLSYKKDSLTHIIPTTILADKEVLSLVVKHGDIVADIVSSAEQEDHDEFVEKLKAIKQNGNGEELFASFCDKIDESIFHESEIEDESEEE